MYRKVGVAPLTFSEEPMIGDGMEKESAVAAKRGTLYRYEMIYTVCRSQRSQPEKLDRQRREFR